MLLFALTACNSSAPLHLFTKGFACDQTGLSTAETTHAQAMSDDGTLRAQLEDGWMMLHLGTALDSGLDDDNCDDFGSGAFSAEVYMVYERTAGSITSTDGPEGRSFTLTDVVLTPQPAPEGFEHYEDPDEHEPITLDGVLEWIPIGGAAGPIEP